MGRIVVTEFVSLDGVMEAPGGEPGYPHTGWVTEYPDPEVEAFKAQEVFEAEAHLLGRVTYESFAGAWPHYEDEIGFADKMNAFPKYVVTNTVTRLDWNNSTALEGPVADSVRDLRDRTDGILLVAGSRTLVHELLATDLVDELRLTVFPLILGSGFRVFPEVETPMRLTLADSRAFPSGVTVQIYRRA
ncbi:dihydrofolate reductase family protein [Gordonia soli]|uniref:dihydrofolate reductase family protein n=1 Tax=Gordonia soli TaxID=320799 RepID=UPI00058F1A72|nr:dihydrofolate reductase family protein [Gordonia soli]